MDFSSIEALVNAGFIGHLSVKQLLESKHLIPNVKGVYMVYRVNPNTIIFNEVRFDGYTKQKDLKKTILELNNNWVVDTPVVYIGKAGGVGPNGKITKATLRTRIWQYLRFGLGKNSGHPGGKLIWHLSDAQDLVFCWKTDFSVDPSVAESDLIRKFRDQYGKRPFANLTD